MNAVLELGHALFFAGSLQLQLQLGNTSAYCKECIQLVGFQCVLSYSLYTGYFLLYILLFPLREQQYCQALILSHRCMQLKIYTHSSVCKPIKKRKEKSNRFLFITAPLNEWHLITHNDISLNCPAPHLSHASLQ